MYDIIVIGAGPAGLTAAIYARRAERSVLIIEKECFGGQITHSPKIENYPGFESLSGSELADKMFEQATALGAEIELDTVTGVDGEKGKLKVTTETNEFFGKAVIIAVGAEHRTLGLKDEELYTGEGISYCAVCDGAFYKDKRVAVIGGGNSALQDAVLLSESVKEVTVIQNLPYLTGEQALENVLKNRDNVRFIFNTTVSEILSQDGVFTGIKLGNSESGTERELALDGMFVAIGQKPSCKGFANVIKLDEYGYIEAGEDCTPSSRIPGIFTAGDCRTKQIRQVTTACSDGSIAALSACRFIDSL